MASALQELRKAAGYKTAKEFAAGLDIPATTYGRYESAPEKIPLSSAWVIADALGCTIDAVVGRSEPDPSATRGDAQRMYDDLSEDSRGLTDMFMAMLKGRDQFKRKEKLWEESDRNIKYVRYYERLLDQASETDGELGDILIFGSDDQKENAFYEFVSARAKSVREGKIEERLCQIDIDLDIKYGFLTYDDEGHLCGSGLQDDEARERMKEEFEELEQQARKELEEEDAETLRNIMRAYRYLHGERPRRGLYIEYQSAALRDSPYDAIVREERLEGGE